MKKTEPLEPMGRRYRTSRQVRERYGGISSRQQRRWVEAGVLPRPDLTIRGRDYWLEETLDANDRKHVADASKRLQASHFTQRSERAMAE